MNLWKTVQRWCISLSFR